MRGSRPKTPVAEKIRRRVNIEPESGCHEWQGAKVNGYGRITLGTIGHPDRRSIGTHKLIYELTYGTVPDGMQVCHKCDNRCCVNIDHLFLGTAKDNAEDRENKGRGNQLKGSQSTRAKLTEDVVLEIRGMRERGVSSMEIARLTGVHKATVNRAIAGASWAHIESDIK